MFSVLYNISVQVVKNICDKSMLNKQHGTGITLAFGFGRTEVDGARISGERLRCSRILARAMILECLAFPKSQRMLTENAHRVKSYAHIFQITTIIHVPYNSALSLCALSCVNMLLLLSHVHLAKISRNACVRVSVCFWCVCQA